MGLSVWQIWKQVPHGYYMVNIWLIYGSPKHPVFYHNCPIEIAMGDPKVEFASVWNNPKLAFRKGNMEGKRSIMVLGMEHMDMFSGRKNKLGNKGNHQHWQERKGIRNKRESGKRWMWYVVSRRGRNTEMKRFQVKPTWEAIKRNMKPSQLIKYNQIVMICFQNSIPKKGKTYLLIQGWY